MTAIEVQNLTYKYQNAEENALEDLSLQVEEGEFLGILGETGAGKSTLLSSMCGVIPYLKGGTYDGDVIVDGKSVEDYGTVYEMASTISMVLQNPESQLFNLRVFDEVIWGPENLSGMNRDEIIEQGKNAMSLFGLDGFEDRITYNLSGGEKQKVAIASIFAMNPDIMLLDEPTSQLDPIGTEMVFDAVDELINQGITIVMVTHKIDKLAEYADKIAYLHEGSITDFEETESYFTDLNAEDRLRPQVTDLGIQLKKAGVSDLSVPITLDGAENEYAKIFDGGV